MRPFKRVITPVRWFSVNSVSYSKKSPWLRTQDGLTIEHLGWWFYVDGWSDVGAGWAGEGTLSFLVQYTTYIETAGLNYA